MIKRIFLVIVILCGLISCHPYIHGAVKSNKLEKVKAFVEKGHVNDREEIYQHTPLIIASYYGYTEIAEFLLQNGADPNIQGKDGTTALIFAAYYNYHDIVKILLANGALADLKDKKGHTAIYYAELHRNKEAYELLKQNDASNE